MKILSVDDDPSTTGLLSVILRGGGHTVFSAHSAEDALEILGREAVDLLITDYCLPYLEGREWLTTVRSLRGCANLPIILCSGGDYSSELAGLPNLIQLPKPFNIPRLIAQVNATAQTGALA